MSGRGRAAVAGDSQGDGGRSRLIGWEARAEGPLTAFRMTVVVRVGERLGSTFKWGVSDCAEQALIGLLARTHSFEGMDMGPILADISKSMALERADGNWELAFCHRGGPCRPRSFADLTAQFNKLCAQRGAVHCH